MAGTKHFDPRNPNRGKGGWDVKDTQESTGKKVGQKLKGRSDDVTSIFEGEEDPDGDDDISGRREEFFREMDDD